MVLAPVWSPRLLLGSFQLLEEPALLEGTLHGEPLGGTGLFRAATQAGLPRLFPVPAIEWDGSRDYCHCGLRESSQLFILSCLNEQRNRCEG